MANKVIYGFPLGTLLGSLSGQSTTVQMPVDATILGVGYQDGVLQLWALAVPGISYENRTFITYPSGATVLFPESKSYVNTAVSLNYGGTLVTHVFEQH